MRATGTRTTVIVEMLVFDLRRDKLVWAATSETRDQKNLQEFIGELVSAAVKEMQKAKFIGLISAPRLRHAARGRGRQQLHREGERLVGLSVHGQAFTFAMDNIVLASDYNDAIPAGDYRQSEGRRVLQPGRALAVHQHPDAGHHVRNHRSVGPGPLWCRHKPQVGP